MRLAKRDVFWLKGERTSRFFGILRLVWMAPRVSTLPIQPKIPEISVGTWNRTDYLGLVRPEYLGAALKVVHFDRSGYLGRSDRNVSFHSAKLLSPVPLFRILLTRTITKRAWLGSGLSNQNVPFHWTRGISEISKQNFCWMESSPRLPLYHPQRLPLGIIIKKKLLSR